MPHSLRTAESQEQGNSCRSATARLPPALGEFPRASAETSLHAQPGCRLQPPLFPRRLLICFKSLPALVFLSTPCKSHTTLSLSPTDSLPLHCRTGSICCLRSFILLCLKPPSLPGPVLSTCKSLGGRQILPSRSGPEHGNAPLTAHRQFYIL